jgi:hypothetical protein
MSNLNHAAHLNSGTVRVSSVVPGRTTYAQSSASRAIFAAGFTCGVLDITAAFVNWTLRGVGPERLLQSIASGLLGPQSFQGGWATATLGLGLHFLIAFSAATAFYLASRKLKFLTQRAILSGISYGVAVYIFMYWIVVPLSCIRRMPFSLSQTIVAITVHIICVGLPISLNIRRFAPAPKQL